MSVPAGFRLAPDRGNRTYAGGRLLVGGSPRRALRLTDGGAEVARRLLAGAPVTDRRDAALARRLLDGELAHPVPPPQTATFDVVVPAYNAVDSLARCLASMPAASVTVVDDGSPDPHAIREAALRHGASVVRLPANRGPGAARNAGSAGGTADVIAFVDSDAVVDDETLRRLSAHFADPAVVAVAPRVTALDPGHGALGALARSWSPLDLGPQPASVRPGARVAYVPSTVLLVRRDAFVAASGFDESLRYGEDVDLIWRLVAAGGSVRYDPTVQVRHAEPATWREWLRRRANYGTSAAPLAVRHGSAAAPLRVRVAPAATVLLALAGRPAIAGAVASVTSARLHRRLRAAAVPATDAAVAALTAPSREALGSARWATQLWWPALLVVAVRARRARPAVVAAATVGPLLKWWELRPDLDPLRWTAAVLADEMAYGAGVWRGCLRERTLQPMMPALDVPASKSPARSPRRHIPDTAR